MIRSPTRFPDLTAAALSLFMAVIAVFGLSNAASAHPHVFVSAKASVVFNSEGEMTGVRHSWTFDKPYSAYIIQGLDTNNDGILSEEELAPLAKENTEGLVEFDYFTALKINGKEQKFDTPREERMTFADGSVTLHFLLPLKKPLGSIRIIGLEIYDPTYFVAFNLVNTDDAITVAGGNKNCAVTVTRAKQADISQQSLSEDFFETLTAKSDFGLQFANRAVVACP